MINPKAYLNPEMERNKLNAQLFTDILQRVFGPEYDVLVGHHVTFEKHGDITTEDEIPSADTLLFCHEILQALFGPGWEDAACELVLTPAHQREAKMAELLRAQDEYNRSSHVTEVA